MVLVAFGLALLIVEPLLDWLPLINDPRPLIGALLGAQAAIAALTLAVTLFVLQGVSTRRDADNRMHSEYVRRSWVRPILWGSLVAVGFTGAMLLAAPKVPNPAFVAACALAENILMALLLFERARRLAQPDEWVKLRREIYEQDVRNAVRAFLRRYRQAIANQEAGESEGADMIADPDEGAANEAIRALLGDALRAMGEWRQRDYEWALDTVRGLVDHAMDEIEREGLTWDVPGSQPAWPPLAELGRNLYQFREEVINRGPSWYANQLASLDLRLAGKGFDRRCGELFTEALRGYGWNYAIASRVGNSQFRGLFRDRAWLYLRDTFDAESAAELPYLREAARHQGRLLFRAMRGQHFDDFKSLRDGFAEMIRNVGQSAEMKASWDANEQIWVEQAEQERHVVLMEVGGITMRLAAMGELADPQPYLDLLCSEYSTPEQLAEDISRAIELHDSDPFFWDDLLDSPSVAIEWTHGAPSIHSLPFFSVRLLELADAPIPDLDLQGKARRVRDWFNGNAARYEQYVRSDSRESIDMRRQRVVEALEKAVEKDELAGPGAAR